MPEILPTSDARGCTAGAQVDSDSGVLCCWLPEGHDGPHYDRLDDISWSRGLPDAAIPR